MLDFIVNTQHSGRENSAPRQGLYCVWTRAHEGENAPLICIWIDSSMSLFEPTESGSEAGPDEAGAGLEAKATS